MRRGAFLLLLLATCGGLPIQRRTSAGPLLPSRAVAVYPFALRWSAPAYRSYELAMDEVDAVVGQGSLSAIGPTEFRVLDPANDALFTGTDLAGSLSAWGLRPENLLGLRGWAERREISGVSTIYDKAGQPVGRRRDVDVRLVVHEDLLGPSTGLPSAPGSLVAEVWAEVRIDPFADHPDTDDLPELRRAVGRLTRAVLALAEPRLRTVPQVTDPGIDLVLNPRDELAFDQPGRPALATLLAGAGPIDREAAQLERLLYFDPAMTPARAALLEALPQGLFVTKVRSTAALRSGLREGDLIARVAGAPAAGQQTLLRWLSSEPTGTPVPLTVLRGADRLELKLPSPPH